MSSHLKYFYEEPVYERGIEIGIRIHSYSEEKILDEFWQIWCVLKEKDGFDRNTFKEEDCIQDWIEHFNARYIN